MIPQVEDSDLRPYVGFVLKVDDPRGEHRVCVEVPGLTDDTGWARPRSTMGGGLQHGGHIVPRVGSRVIVTYEYGNPERPLYEPAAWVAEDVPADIVAAGNEAHLVQAFEFAKLGPISFRVTLDERPATRSFRIYAVDADNGDSLIAALELDLVSRATIVYGLTGVEIRSTGFIQLAAALIQFNDRALLPAATPV